MQKKRWTIVDGVSLAQAYQVTKAGYNSYYLNDTFIFDDSVSTDPTEIEGNTGSNDWLRSKNGTINSSGRCCNLRGSFQLDLLWWSINSSMDQVRNEIVRRKEQRWERGEGE